jgi:uncharacterized membrane protein YeaQ/YmgE (transglycosylase-associated protein family)
MSRLHLHLLHVQHLAKENEMENSKLNLVAFGWALSGALVVLLVLCEAAAMLLPGWRLTHNWLMLFSTAEVGSIRNLIDGIISSAVFGWIVAVALVLIYNRLVRR